MSIICRLTSALTMIPVRSSTGGRAEHHRVADREDRRTGSAAAWRVVVVLVVVVGRRRRHRADAVGAVPPVDGGGRRSRRRLGRRSGSRGQVAIDDRVLRPRRATPAISFCLQLGAGQAGTRRTTDKHDRLTTTVAAMTWRGTGSRAAAGCATRRRLRALRIGISTNRYDTSVMTTVIAIATDELRPASAGCRRPCG